MNYELLLHSLARVLLRVTSPERAHRTLQSIGRVLPPAEAMTDVREAVARLRNRGTCLSRALALAARVPRSEVILGVDRAHRNPLRAHAWIEVAGEKIEDLDAIWMEIARLPGRTGLSRRH